MKTTYQKPEILIERVETQGLLALSMVEGQAVQNSEVLSKDNYGDEEYWED